MAFNGVIATENSLRTALEHVQNRSQMERTVDRLYTSDTDSLQVVTYLLEQCVLAQAGGATASPTGSAFKEAKDQWVADGLVAGGAGQDVPLEIALTDLRRGLANRPKDPTPYLVAIAALEAMMWVPDAMVTPAENALWGIAASAVAPYFGSETGGALPAGHFYEAAERAWEREPSGASSGVVRAPIRTAIADLLSASRGSSPYDAAAVDDLRSLATASRADVAAQNNNVYGDEIEFLNVFFDDPSFENFHTVLESPQPG